MKLDPSRYQALSWKQLKDLKLFSHGKRLAHAGESVRAYIIFDWLLVQRPECREYQRCLARCRAKIIRDHKNLSQQDRLFRTPRYSRESLDARLLSIFLPIADQDCLQALLEIIRGVENPYIAIPLEVNWHARQQDSSQWATMMNRYLNLFFSQQHTLSIHSQNNHIAGPRHLFRFLTIEDKNPARVSARIGPLVTIIMSAYNSESTIGYAIRSLLKQDYEHFELLIVDDASTDQTAEVITEFARSDPRIIPIFLIDNRGPYSCRNIALSKASGTFVTTHDSDDFCHPLRLRVQAEFLEHNPSKLAVISQWLRIRENGEIMYHNKRGGDFLHGGLATMMYRRDIVSTIGFYDQVRYSADTEYLFRIRSVYGPESVGIIRKPLVLAAAIENSLTAAKATFTDSFLGDCESRAKYRDTWEDWHQKEGPQLYVPLNPESRPFPAPQEMLSKPDTGAI